MRDILRWMEKHRLAVQIIAAVLTSLVTSTIKMIQGQKFQSNRPADCRHLFPGSHAVDFEKGQGKGVMVLTEKEKQLQEKIKELLAVMTDAEADRLLAYTEGMYAAVTMRLQSGA